VSTCVRSDTGDGRSEVSARTFASHAFRVGFSQTVTGIAGIKGHLWEQVYLPTQLQRRLLWSPGNTGPVGVRRQVLTVHDMASLDHPEWFERKFALWYAALLPRLIRNVRAIITVSHFSRERIVRLTGVKPERVHVIFNGVDRRFRPAEPKIVKIIF
jgi:hypothetical protein